MRGNVFQYDNKEFYSIKALANYAGINEKTLAARLRRNMSVNEACKREDLRCTYFLDEDRKKSIIEICNEQTKEHTLVRNRLKYGYSMCDALNTPKRITRQGKPVVVNGILYNSVAQAVKKLGLEKKESTIRRRLKEGRNPDAAFMFEKE